VQYQVERAPEGHFVKGQAGNPATKPKGCRNHASRTAELVLDGEVEALTPKAMLERAEHISLWIGLRGERGEGRPYGQADDKLGQVGPVSALDKAAQAARPPARGGRGRGGGVRAAARELGISRTDARRAVHRVHCIAPGPGGHFNLEERFCCRFAADAVTTDLRYNLMLQMATARGWMHIDWSGRRHMLSREPGWSRSLPFIEVPTRSRYD